MTYPSDHMQAEPLVHGFYDVDSRKVNVIAGTYRRRKRHRG